MTTITRESTTVFTQTVSGVSTSRIPVLPTPSAPTIHDSLAKEFKLRATAMEDGRQQLPAWDSHKTSLVEEQIEQTIKDAWIAASEQARQQQEAINHRLNDLRLEVRSFHVEVVEAQVLEGVRALFHEQEIDRNYRDFYRDCKLKQTEYQHFRAANQLTHEASYPESKVLHLALILLICFVESVANSFLFASGSDFGWIGGVAQAVVISGVNAGALAFFCGFFAMRYSNHISRKLRLIGTLGIGVFIIATIIFNLAVGHYRQALIVGIEDPARVALQSFVAHPAALADLEAWLLFFLGICAFGAAVYKFYHLSDRYPRYETLHREFKAADNRLNERFRAVQDQAKRELDSAIGKLDSSVDKLRNWVKEFDKTSLQVPSVAAALKKDAETLDSAFHSLLKEYRNINASVRATEHPKYWQLDPPLRNMLADAESAIKSAEATFAELQVEVEGFRQKVEEVRAELSKARSALRQGGDNEIHAGLVRMKEGLNELWRIENKAPVHPVTQGA